MATPTLRALRHRWPDATFVGVMRPWVAETLRGLPWLDEECLFDPHSSDRGRRMPAVTRFLRDRRLDLAVLFPNDFRSALVGWLAGATRRVGYDRELRGLLLTDRLRVRRYWNGYRPTPLVDYYLELARHLGADPGSHRLELATTSEDEATARALLERHGVGHEPLVVFNPGGAFGPAKRWPSESFAELGRRLARRHGASVLVLCGPTERALAREIVAYAACDRVTGMEDEPVSIGLAKAIVRQSQLMVTTDSGPRHFAVAFGVPTVSLFGPTYITWTETDFPAEIRLQQKVACGPCQQRTCPRGHHRCMRDLSVDRVYQAARMALEQSMSAACRAS